RSGARCQQPVGDATGPPVKLTVRRLGPLEGHRHALRSDGGVIADQLTQVTECVLDGHDICSSGWSPDSRGHRTTRASGRHPADDVSALRIHLPHWPALHYVLEL